MSVLKAAYPRYYSGQSGDELKAAVSLWHTMFEEYDYRLVSKAVKALIATLKFPPSVADVTEKIQLLTQPKQMEPMAAWALVKKAIGNSLYNADREFANLPEEIQETIGSPEQLRAWARDDEGATNTVTASNFQRSYQAKVKNIREYKAMPKDVRELIDDVARRLPGLEESHERNKNFGALPEMRSGAQA